MDTCNTEMGFSENKYTPISLLLPTLHPHAQFVLFLILFYRLCFQCHDQYRFDHVN
jgi:hypothetical protein